MTDLHACCDPFVLLSVERLKFHCLAQANMLLSRRPLCQAWLWGHYKRENPSSPFFHYKKKRLSASIKVVNGSYSRHLENVNFFGHRVGMIINHGDSVIPPWSGFIRETVAACAFKPSKLFSAVFKYRSAEHMWAWRDSEISTSAFLLFALTIAADVDMNKLPTSVVHTT